MSIKRALSAREHVTEFVVGLFFFAALILLALFTIVLKKDLLWKETYTRRVDFADVGGLSAGDKVLVRGMHVGKVASLELSKNADHIRLQLQLNRRVPLYRDCRVEIRSSSIIGGQFVYIEPGTRDAGEVGANDILKGRSGPDFMAEAGEFVRQLKESGIIDEVQEIARRIRSVSTKIDEGTGSVGKLVNDDHFYEDARAALASLRQAGTNAQTALDALGGAGEEIHGAIDGAKRAGASIEAAGNSVKQAADNLNATIADVRAGKGAVGKLMTDDALYTDLRAAIADFKQAVAGFSSEKSTISRLLNDDGALYDNVKTSFDSIREAADTTRELTAKIKAGEGTLGKLVADDALYDETRETVNEIRGAVSDFREQTPISTFGSLMLGAF